MMDHYIWSLYNRFVLRFWLSLALLIYIGTSEGAEGTNGSGGGDRPRFCRHVGPVESSPACSICNMVCFMWYYLKTNYVILEIIDDTLCTKQELFSHSLFLYWCRYFHILFITAILKMNVI